MGGADAVSGSERGVDIKVVPNGSVFVGGEFLGSAVFGSQTLVSSGSADAFVTKLDTNGVVQWAKKWGTTAYDTFLGLDVDAFGNTHAVSNRSSDALTIKKFGTSGSDVWTKDIATNAQYALNGDIAVDSSGNAFVTGNFSGTVDFDPSSKTKYVSAGNTSLGLGAGFVLSLNQSGNFRWVSPFLAISNSSGYRGTAYVQSIATDLQGNVLVGGWRAGIIDFQASSATSVLQGESGGFLVNLSNSTGYLRWAKSIDSSGTAYVEDIELDASGNIYLSGAFKGNTDFDPDAGVDSRVPAGDVNDIDAYYMKLSSTGSLLWAETLGGTGSDWARGIAVDGTGAVHVAGQIGPGNGPVDFDPDPSNSQELSTNLKTKGFRLRVRQV